jgi:hypothetical protein
LRVQRSAVVVSGDGAGVAGHAGSRLLVDLADRLGLTAGLGGAAGVAAGTPVGP